MEFTCSVKLHHITAALVPVNLRALFQIVIPIRGQKDLKLYHSFECGWIKDTIRNESAV